MYPATLFNSATLSISIHLTLLCLSFALNFRYATPRVVFGSKGMDEPLGKHFAIYKDITILTDR